MALEDMTGPNAFLERFVIENPEIDDGVNEGDSHLRGLKNCIVNSFAAMDGLMSFVPGTPINIPDVITGVPGGPLTLLADGGNVGIGTAAPLDKLSLEGVGEQHLSIFSDDLGVINLQKTFLDFNLRDGAGTKRIAAQLAAAPGTSATSAGQLIFNLAAVDLSFQERMRIDENGRLGVGTPIPPALLSAQLGDNGLYMQVGGDNTGPGVANGLAFTSSDLNGATHTIDARTGAGVLNLATAGNISFSINNVGDISMLFNLGILNGTLGVGRAAPAQGMAIGPVTPGTASLELPIDSLLSFGADSAISHVAGSDVAFGATTFKTNIRGLGVDIRNNQGNIWSFTTGGAFIAPAAVNINTGDLTLSLGNIITLGTGAAGRVRAERFNSRSGVYDFDSESGSNFIQSVAGRLDIVTSGISHISVAPGTQVTMEMEPGIVRLTNTAGGANTMALELVNDFKQFLMRVEAGTNNWELVDATGAAVRHRVTSSGLHLLFLPTSNPGSPGALWNNGGVVNVSP